MNELSAQRRELTTQEKHAAMLWVEGIDIDGNEVRTKAEIAKASGMTQGQLQLLFKRQEFLDELDKRLLQQKINSGRELMKNVPKAVNRLVKIIENGADREAFQAAAKLLSIAGFSDHVTVDLNPNDVAGVVRGGFGREELPEVDTIPMQTVDGDEDDET